MSTMVAVTASLSPGSGARPERATLNIAYIAALEGARLAPLLVTPGMQRATLEALLGASGGLCLTGGGDIDPARYGQEPAGTKMDSVIAARDSTEIAALAIADDLGLPVLAICRGMQLLNVARGGTLKQDIPGHSQTDDGTARNAPTHGVRISAGTRLATIIGATELRTNSMHHQAVGELAGSLVETGWAEDGIIEAVEETGTRFVVGVQWHPEELVATQEQARRLFAAFAAACTRKDD